MALADDGGDAPADVVVTTGGTGKGGSGHFRDTVRAMGGRLVVDGIAMRPGHPTVLAELPDGRFFLGLPGNPLAAVVELPAGESFAAELARTRVVPFRWVYGMASPATGVGSGMLRGLAQSDGLMVVPPHGVELGRPVPCLPLPWGRALTGSGPGARGGERPKRRRSVASKDPVDWSALEG